MSSNYHFYAVRPVEDLVLSAEHKLSGRVAQYLREFQLDGIRFLYKHFENNESCILNDESGLGKTATVCAFLETVLPHDATRNCLIIVKNDERLKNWKFHLEALTKLPNKVVFKNEDVSKGIVFLTKWDSLQKSASLAKHVFDCVIIDNRGELLANKICCGYLLRNYVNKISLIVSSADVAIDLRQFHMMLKMCGRLGKIYDNFKVFEEKFALLSPNGASEDVNLLEAYFLRRERIINFCREFRLRRYRHQYDDVLPLAHPDDCIKSLNAWITTPSSYSKSSSSSVKILSSSSEKDAEQLLKSYFDTKEKRDKDIVKCDKINQVILGFGDDVDDMPPLLLESDSEERPADRFKRSQKSKQLEAGSIAIEIDIKKKNVNDKSEPKWKKIHDEKCTFKSTTRSRKNVNTDTNASGRTNMRSLHATRSKTQKNKYLLFGYRSQEKNKKRTNKKVITGSDSTKKSRMRKQYMKTKVENVETYHNNTYLTRSRVKKMSCKVFDDLDKLNKKKLVRKNGVNSKIVGPYKKCKETNNNVKAEKAGRPKGVIKKKKFVEKKRKFQKPKNNIKNVLETHPSKAQTKTVRTCVKETGVRRCDMQEEVLLGSPQDDVIVLSSTTDNCTPLSLSNNMKTFQTAGSLLSSPDIFSNVTDDCDILCSQRDKLPGRFTMSSSIRKTETTIIRSRNSSCLDLLEKEFCKEKSNMPEKNEQILETSFDKNFVHLNQEICEVTPFKSRAATSQKNKITKYLIGSEPANQGNLLQLSRNDENLEDSTRIEGCPKTPKKSKITQRNVNIFSKSPKIKVSKDITPNSLKKWLLTSQTTNEDIVKSSKRRRLDLWFND